MKCQVCKKDIGKNETSTKCPKCNMVFHKLNGCLKNKFKNFKKAVKCPVCLEATYGFSRKSCPKCGKYLFSFHFGCQQEFIKNR